MWFSYISIYYFLCYLEYYPYICDNNRYLYSSKHHFEYYII